MKELVLKSGTKLPLMQLKGKDYLIVAYRLLWLNDEYKNFTISTSFLSLTDNEAVAHAVITIKDENGNTVKQATGTKREDKKSFADFTEKAETGAIGRACAALGLGTAQALADLDEGVRIVDAPLEGPKQTVIASGAMTVIDGTEAPQKMEIPPSKSSFRKPKKTVDVAVSAEGNGWE